MKLGAYQVSRIAALQADILAALEDEEDDPAILAAALRAAAGTIEQALQARVMQALAFRALKGE